MEGKKDAGNKLKSVKRKTNDLSGENRNGIIDLIKILVAILVLAVCFFFGGIFLTNVLLSIPVFVFSYMNVFSLDSQRFKKNYIRFLILSLAIIVYFLTLGALGFYNEVIGAYHYMAFFTASALVLGFSFAIKRTSHNIFRVIFKAFMVSVFLEILIFNFNSFKINLNDYTDAVKVSKVVFNNFDGEKWQTDSNDEAIIEILGIDERIGTLYLDASSENSKKIRVNIDFSDETTREYRYNIASGEIVNDCEESFFIPINASGKVGNLKIKIKPYEGDVITINELRFNKVIPFYFSFSRILFILGVAFLKYLFIDSKRYSKTFKENERLCVLSARWLTIFLIVAAFLIIIVQRDDLFSNIFDDFKTEEGNQITKELVDSFEDGRLDILEEVPEELKNLDNPYDDSQRKGIYYLWDHLYYDGNYYSYYGIAPVIILCLPFHLITGYYFPSIWCTFIFGAIGIFFLYKLYMEYIKEFFYDIKISFAIMGLITLQLISGVWFCFATGNFYEIAQASGFAFVTSGGYFMLISGVIGKRKINLFYLSLSAVLLALGVLSRPTLAVYCICALIFIFAGIMKKRRGLMSEGKNRIGFYISYLAAAFLPFILIGGLQMIYNYLRFGNIMDFGIQYSLTINDFTNTEFHSHFAGIGFYNYLFAIPNISPSFPFISSHVETFNPNGYYFVATNTAIGLFIMAPICFSYFYSKKAYAVSKSENRKLYFVIISAVCVIAPLVIIASVWESGYGIRYKTDFAWQFLIGAFTIAFIIYKNCENENIKKIMAKAFFAFTVLCFILSFTQSYTYILKASHFNHEALDKYLYAFERAFEFWR